jgi:hypothetical protein
MNNRRNTIIVVVVVVILLCCCCPAISYGLYYLWSNGDQLFGRYLGLALPTLLAL